MWTRLFRLVVACVTLTQARPLVCEKFLASVFQKFHWSQFPRPQEIAALDLPQESASETAKFNTLKNLKFFADFTDIELWEVVRISVWGRVPGGTYLFHEGDEGNFFFILAEGEVRATKGTRSLGTHGAGHCFGEMCYIRQSAIARTATIMAITPAKLFKIKRESLASASESCQLKFNKAFLNILVDRLAETDAELVGVHH